MVICGSLISALLVRGDQTTIRTPVVLQDTWVSHYLLNSAAPEVMCRQNHGVAVDYFAVGIIAFECMFGRVSLTT